MEKEMTISQKRVSDVIDLERDILPYRLVQLIAGVGAGKNYWVRECLLKTRNPKTKKPFNILLITSRAVTADVQAANMKANRWIDLEALQKRGIGTKEQKTVVVTNSGIGNFIKNKYQIDDFTTHIWNYFDFIVLDEAHSLATDAVFADAPFYVLQFLKQALIHSKDCHIILMTGTPRPVEWLFTMLKKLLENDNESNFLNIYDECRHIEPHHVILERRISAFSDIVQELKRGHRILYFARTIRRIKALYEKLTRDKSLKELGITARNIGIAYADNRANQKRETWGSQDSDEKSYALTEDEVGEDDNAGESKWFPAEALKIKDQIRASIEDKGMIPDEIKILLTTSTFKEGVDICNEDIKVVFAESMIPAELVQMAGRLRNGIDELRVLYSLQDCRNFDDINYEWYVDECCLEEVNQAYQKYYIKQIATPDLETNLANTVVPPANALFLYSDGKDGLNKLITLIHKKFPNIRYDYFSDKFMLYEGKIEGNNYLVQAFYRVSRYQRHWWYDEIIVTDDEVYDNSGKSLFNKYFPYSVVELWDRRKATLKVCELLRAENCLNVEISLEKRDEIIQKIKDSIDIEILEKAQEDPGKTPRQPKKYMEMFGIALEETPGKRKGSSYRMSFISSKKNQENEELIIEW